MGSFGQSLLKHLSANHNLSLTQCRSGPTGQAFLTRMSALHLDTGAFDKIDMWSNSHTWVPYNDFNVSNVAVLFDYMASETTLQYHSVLQAWFVIIVNSFVYGPTIMMRAATLLNGTWSSPIPLFTIPPQFLQKSDFCYAGKVGFVQSPSPIVSTRFDLLLPGFPYSP